ncbi:hypothetical protein VNO78_31928 [Psophocarpus tetragonolobus]|uniref:Uncharacterized protein n=1 Tax=Psophocarpus tetragonolobus TaxID=3891 RepID=A0AAN9X906_PSOTE
MEGSRNGTLQDSQKVETEILSEDKEVAVEVDDTPDCDIAITDEEEAPKNEMNKELVESASVEHTYEDVSESVTDTFEPYAVKDGKVQNKMESHSLELELKKEQRKDFLSVVNDEVKETDLPSSEDNNELSSGNEGLGETEVVETIAKHMTVAEEKNVLSNVVTEKGEETKEVYGDSSLPLTEVASEETVETSVIKSDESDKVAPTTIEKSLALDEKVEKPSGGQEESSNGSAKESFKPSPSAPDAESSQSTQNPVGDSHFMIVSY